MPSRIKQIHSQLLDIITSIQVEGSNYFVYSNIFDDQIDEAIKGNTYSYAIPAIFVEIQFGEAKPLGQGYTSYPDTKILFHIYTTFLNDPNGGMERNLPVFDIRDTVVSVFNVFPNLQYCSTLQMYYDKPDYKHNNVYKYIVGFSTNFLDSKGSIYDSDNPSQWGYLKNPVVNLNLFKPWVTRTSYISNVSQLETYIDEGLQNVYINEFGDIYITEPSTTLLFCNVVSYGGQLYACLNSNSDTIFNPSNWILIESWLTKKNYKYGDFAVYANILYICISDNNDENFDINKWLTITR